jgi:hypothetical protein
MDWLIAVVAAEVIIVPCYFALRSRRRRLWLAIASVVLSSGMVLWGALLLINVVDVRIIGSAPPVLQGVLPVPLLDALPFLGYLCLPVTVAAMILSTVGREVGKSTRVLAATSLAMAVGGIALGLAGGFLTMIGT